jgi:hypothetical protein
MKYTQHAEFAYTHPVSEFYEQNPRVIHENIRHKFICHPSEILEWLGKIPMEHCHL